MGYAQNAFLATAAGASMLTASANAELITIELEGNVLFATSPTYDGTAAAPGVPVTGEIVIDMDAPRVTGTTDAFSLDGVVGYSIDIDNGAVTFDLLQSALDPAGSVFVIDREDVGANQDDIVADMFNGQIEQGGTDNLNGVIITGVQTEFSGPASAFDTLSFSEIFTQEVFDNLTTTRTLTLSTVGQGSIEVDFHTINVIPGPSTLAGLSAAGLLVAYRRKRDGSEAQQQASKYDHS